MLYYGIGDWIGHILMALWLAGAPQVYGEELPPTGINKNKQIEEFV